MLFYAKGETNWLFLFIIILLAAFLGGWILISQNLLISSTKRIDDSAIWDCAKIDGCLEKWHNCPDFSCAANLMQQYGAAPEAVSFINLLSDKGYLNQFKKMGRIGLGTVVFPDRANTNEAYYLLNGTPAIVSVEISQEQEQKITEEFKKDRLYKEMEEKYPNIWFWGFASEFVKKEMLFNGTERFVFQYNFVNGCRICETEYRGQIGFNFNLKGEFIGEKFISIVRKEI